MDENRKKIIIKEIMFWKNNRLLPEHYCDYLLALYSEGEDINEPEEKTKKLKLFHPYYALSFLPFIVFAFMYYFTEFSIFFQLLILGICILFNFLLIGLCKKKQLNFQIPLVATAFFLLLSSIYMTKIISADTIILFSVVAVNCVLWILAGLKGRFHYFTISGIIGIGLIILSFFL